LLNFQFIFSIFTVLKIIFDLQKSFKANAVEIIFKSGINKIKYESVLQQVTSFDIDQTLSDKRFQRNIITLSKEMVRIIVERFFKFCLKNRFFFR